MQGEALGIEVLGDVRRDAGGWAGPWRAGVRPGLGLRVGGRPEALRPEREEGRRIR